MVIFGLFGEKRNTSNNTIPPNFNTIINKEIDVLDQLMDLNNNYGRNTKDLNKSNGLNTSSFNLDEIANRISIKNNNASINYKNALINSLYSQVEYLRGESIRKDNIIQNLINNSAINASKINAPMCNSSSVESIPEVSNPQENPLFNDYDNLRFNAIDNSSLYSDISATSLINSTPDENISSESFNNNTVFAAWEKYSSGFGSRMLHKFGYNGGGIGKHGNGIINPIEASSGMKHFSLNDGGICHRVENNIHCWSKGTTLITGSSIIMGLEENRLRKYKAKVRAFPGALVDDMYDYLLPLLKKKPSNIIIHIGSNDAPNKSANEIANEIRCLKYFIDQMVPGVKIFVSCPVTRLDNKKANSTLCQLSILLKDAGNIICNDNVDPSCLGRKGLHLNAKGSGRLAMNFISLMRRL